MKASVSEPRHPGAPVHLRPNRVAIVVHPPHHTAAYAAAAAASEVAAAAPASASAVVADAAVAVTHERLIHRLDRKQIVPQDPRPHVWCCVDQAVAAAAAGTVAAAAAVAGSVRGPGRMVSGLKSEEIRICRVTLLLTCVH